ncbi:hypothetical protein QJU96_07150 [Pasteurella skyensis]|uniref:Uncharacterized protein n=1 Tax=Phocoenobacter skyensis TaxID=97481 RepID=A0AAJ6NEM0_9PAST|nr:hypothetical protein [Pasteurella skyensis]MDP8171062.1 hypothetical protein [Pasteurella skyensis]MDP8175347.1 hypothetical protein [Pasteurella skyensis]
MSGNDALLARISYINFFDDKKDFLEEKDKKVRNKSIYNILATTELSEEDITYFTEHYEIIAQQRETLSGYSGIIVKEKASNQYIVVHRGTADAADLAADGELAITGITMRQYVDAMNFINSAVTSKDDNFNFIKRKTHVIKPGVKPPLDFEVMAKKGSGIIDSNATFRQVGHSLGYELGTLIHFTHNKSSSVNGFDGAGADIDNYTDFLQDIAEFSNSKFDFSKRDTLTNYVGSGIRLVANDLVYNQYGKIVVLKKSPEYISHYRPEKIASYDSIKDRNLYLGMKAAWLELKGHKINSLIDSGYDLDANTLYTIAPTKLDQEYSPSLPSISDSFSLSSHGLTSEMAKKMFKETKSEFKYLTTQPTEKLPDGRFKYDPVYTDYGWGLYADANTLNLDAYADRDKVDNATNTFKSNTVTDDFRLSNGNKSEKPISDISLPVKIIDIADSLTLNNASNLGKSVLPTDPLILDLNGDGIHLSSYNDNKILFDIDNDGGSLEQTGWINADDGFLVNDLNKNGKIDNISEIFSEFYAGKVGKNGETGEKRFKTGFDALRTLDSNNDGVFDKKDNAWNTVRVWKDKNQNDKLDVTQLTNIKNRENYKNVSYKTVSYLI